MQVFERPATRRFLYGFWALRQRMVRHAGPTMKRLHGLDLGDFFLLDVVAREQLSPTEIARHLELPAPAVSRRVEALERLSLIARALDPNDARRHVLSLTAAGRTRLAEAATTVERETESFLDVLDPPSLSSFLDALETLAEDRTP